jgi:hypothetical protein
MIAVVMLMSVALVGILCVVAYTLATYALPLMLGFAVARFAYHTGAGLIGASFIGLIAAAIAFGVFAVLFATLRSPILRLIVALIFAAPAAIAGYALVHGVTHEAIPSAILAALPALRGAQHLRRIDPSASSTAAPEVGTAPGVRYPARGGDPLL